MGETTAALLKDSEARRKGLQERFQALCAPRTAAEPLRVDANAIQARLRDLYSLLEQDPARVNAFFRQHLEPITLTPVEAGGKRYYRASGGANGAEMLKSLGLAQAFDLGGCGGPHSPISLTLAFGVDLGSRGRTGWIS